MSRASFMFFSLSSTISIVVIDRTPRGSSRRPPGAPADAGAQSCGKRYRESERRASAGLAFQPDAAAVQLDEPPRERQAQAGTFLLVRVVAAHLAELLEH